MLLSPRRLQSDSHHTKTCLTCPSEGPSKMMKNAFYFTLKALFALNISGHVKKNGLITNISLIYIIMLPNKKIITFPGFCWEKN